MFPKEKGERERIRKEKNEGGQEEGKKEMIRGEETDGGYNLDMLAPSNEE